MAFKTSLKLKGGKEALKAMQDVRKAAHPDAARASFRKMALYTLRRVRERTPGDGTLRGAWALDFNEVNRNNLEWRIHNRLADQGVTYLSTDLTIKPKLRTFPSDEQQTWGEVIQILDAGGKPHEITPKRTTWLSWWASQPGRNPETGRFQRTEVAVFSKGVSHPGHKKYGMLTGTAKEIQRLIDATAEERKRSILAPWDLRTGAGR